MTEIEITLGEVVDANGALRSLSNNNKLGLSLLWKVTDVIDALETQVKRFGEESDKLLKKYADPHPTMPGRYVPRAEDSEKHQKAMEKLRDEKVNISFTKLDASKLIGEDVKGIANELLPLKKHFIEMKEDKEEEETPEKELKPNK